MDDGDAFVAQLAVAAGQLADLARAPEHEVGERARNELRVALDKDDFDRAAAPGADIARCGGAAEAATDDDHAPGRPGWRSRGAARNRRIDGRSACEPDEI